MATLESSLLVRQYLQLSCMRQDPKDPNAKRETCKYFQQPLAELSQDAPCRTPTPARTQTWFKPVSNVTKHNQLFQGLLLCCFSCVCLALFCLFVLGLSFVLATLTSKGKEGKRRKKGKRRKTERVEEKVLSCDRGRRPLQESAESEMATYCVESFRYA